MKNKELKKELLTNGTYKEYAATRAKTLKAFNYDHEKTYETMSEDYQDIVELEQIRKCKQAQRSKIKDHYSFWTEKHYRIVFGTFTIDEEHRKKMATNKNYFDNFKKAVIRSFEHYADDYILNIDYGSLNEREHFHVLLGFNRYNEIRITKSEEHIGQVEIDAINEKYHLGFTTFKLCGNDKEDGTKLSSYMDKLVSHSIKVKQTYISVKKGSEYQEYKKVAHIVYTKPKMRTIAQREKIKNYIKIGRLQELFNGQMKVIKGNENVLNIDPYQVRVNICNDIRNRSRIE